MQFEWDEAKAEANLRAHGVNFESASTVFRDPLAIEWLDDRKDYGENRFITIGTADDHSLLFVAYTERGEVIRIISARKVTQYEEDQYLQANG